MYNNNVKQEYLTSRNMKTRSLDLFIRMFNELEVYEKEWGKDVYEADVEELEKAFEQISTTSSSTKRMLFYALKSYIEWCKEQGFKNVSDSIFHIKISGLDKIRITMTSGPKSLQRYLDMIYKPDDQQTTDDIYRCFHWLAFMGVKPGDIGEIKVSDVDLFDRVLRLKNNEYKIYDEALPVFRTLKMAVSFVYIHPNYKNPVVWDRIPGDKLIRGCKGFRTFKDLVSETNHKQKKALKEHHFEERYSYRKLFISGYFYRTYELERAGYPVSFAELVEIEVDSTDYKGDEKARNKAMIRRNKFLLMDYDMWKKAFMV